MRDSTLSRICSQVLRCPSISLNSGSVSGVVLARLIMVASGLASIPIALRFSSRASSNVVPLPQKMSATVSPIDESSWISTLGIWGMNLAG